MTTKKKLLNKIFELEHKQELLERKMEYLFNKDDGRAVLSIERYIAWWKNIVRVYYMLRGEVKCVEISTLFEKAKIVHEDTGSIVVCLTSNHGGKVYNLIDKSTGSVVTTPAGFSFEKEEKEGEEEKAND